MNSTNTFKKLAIAGAVSAAMLGATVAEAHVSYNTASSVNGNAQNGAGTWTNGNVPSYAGKLPGNWYAELHSDNETQSLSTAGAITQGAPGTYVLQSLNNKWNPANSWGNALSFGLIELNETSNLTIRVAADTSLGSTFLPGFTLWEGWDTGTGNKHGAWNANPTNPGNRGATGITYYGHASTNSSDNGINYSYSNGAVEITFANLLAGEYNLWIGGNGSGNISTGQQFTVDLTTSAVPIPAAVWLFGSALAGMGIIGRRRDKTPA
jgi:hypothetical protein